MNIFLDTNALIKLYHREKGTEELTNFLNTKENILTLSVTDLSKTEFYSAIYKRVRMGQLKIETAKIVLQKFSNDFDKFNVIRFDDKIFKTSLELLDLHSVEMSLRTLDSLQLAASIVLNNLLKIDYFISSDKILLKAASEYFVIFNPEN